MRVRTCLPVIVLIAAFAAVGCSGEAGRWRVSDLDDPAAVLATVEAKWHAEIEHRGSILHQEAHCYFQLNPAGSTDDEDVLDPLVACGPVSHWKGMVGPTPTPTAHESRGGRHVPVFDPTTFRVPYAGSTKWDYYRFKSIHHLDDDRTKVTATGPMASSHGRRVPLPEEVDRFWRPDHRTPPADMGHHLPTPQPPDEAVIPLDPVLDVDIDHAYRPDTHDDGDLTVTYDLDVTGGTWKDIGLEDTRRLRLNLDADIDLRDGYRLNYAPRDSGTADPDNGDQARSIAEGAVTSHEIDPDSGDHPDLVFDLPADARTAIIELDPQVKFTATDDTGGLPGPDDLHPRGGLLDLPTERFTVQLVTDEQADAAAPK